MGGNAIKNAPVKRLTAEEYYQRVPRVLEIIKTVLGDEVRVEEIKAYFDKPDFGDMDILLTSRYPLDRKWKDKLADAFKSKEVRPNGNVVSYEHDEFQVDVITVPPDEFDYAMAYFSWNDLGNLIGQTSRQLGFKHGFQGLYYSIMRNDQKAGEVMVTKSHAEALDIFGYDSSSFERGFNNLTDIFKFVVSSPYFNKEMYVLKNRNRESRTRDEKRKNYMLFLEWLEDPSGYEAHISKQPSNRLCSPMTPCDQLTFVCMALPEFDRRLQLENANIKNREAAKLKLNGTHVMRLTDATGHQIGAILKSIENRFDCNEGFTQWLVRSEQSVIDELIVKTDKELHPSESDN